MDLKAMAAQMLMAKLGANLGGKDESAIGGALSGLLGGNDKDDLDLGDLAGKFSQGGLGGALQSWLGDGDNDNISGDDVKNVLGADKIGQFAQQLGVDADSAAGGLSDLLPQLLDKNSSGGSLTGLLGLASKFLK